MPMNSTAPPIASATAPRVICPTFLGGFDAGKFDLALDQQRRLLPQVGEKAAQGQINRSVFVHSPLPLLPARPLNQVNQGLQFDQMLKLNPSGAPEFQASRGIPPSGHHDVAGPAAPASGRPDRRRRVTGSGPGRDRALLVRNGDLDPAVLLPAGRRVVARDGQRRTNARA